MPNPFRFSTSMPRLGESVPQWRDQLRRIEDAGYWSVAISDHFTQGWKMEPVVTMAVAAEATSRLRMLTLVLANDYRHPAMLHKALATLDVLSGGRVELGIGTGWSESDYEAINLPLDPVGVRVDRLAESVEIIKGLFGAEPLSYTGKHYQINGLDGLPKPVQTPHPPILIGGGSRRVLELAGASADIIGINASMRGGDKQIGSTLLDQSAERVAAKTAMAKAAAVAAGRDPATLRFQTSIQALDITDVPGARWVTSMAQEVDPAVLATSPAVLRGTVSECVEVLLRRREEFGLDYIHFGGGDPLAAAPIIERLSGR